MIPFNLNNLVHVNLTKRGLHHYVAKHNEGLPVNLHWDIDEMEQLQAKHGYTEIQCHVFLDYFGNLGVYSQQYISNFNISIESPKAKSLIINEFLNQIPEGTTFRKFKDKFGAVHMEKELASGQKDGATNYEFFSEFIELVLSSQK